MSYNSESDVIGRTTPENRLSSQLSRLSTETRVVYHTIVPVPLRKHPLAEPQQVERKVHTRKCVIVSVLETRERSHRDQAFEEIRGLVETAGGEVVGTMLQVRDRPDAASYIGKGKVAELKELMEATEAECVVFDNHLSPSQGKHLEDETGKQVVDRSEVILDIFATHARTYESKLQVELAQLLYMRPRLTRLWTHLERIEGGIGSGKGPGEKQLETDRRLVDIRIAELKKKLAEIEKRREREVKGRKDFMTVGLVGYTNAGKSTLMHALTGADVYIADQLFATLETRTRKWSLPHWGDVLLSDTVGFIRNLPHHLVASFTATLEEARHADLLLHVVDASHPEAKEQIETVMEVLAKIGVDSANPILVLNKADAVTDRSVVDVLRAKYPDSLSVSAKTGTGLDRLATAVADRLGDGYIHARIQTNAGNGKLFAFLAEHGEVINQTYDENLTTLECRVPRRFMSTLFEPSNEVTLLNGASAPNPQPEA